MHKLNVSCMVLNHFYLDQAENFSEKKQKNKKNNNKNKKNIQELHGKRPRHKPEKHFKDAIKFTNNSVCVYVCVCATCFIDGRP